MASKITLAPWPGTKLEKKTETDKELPVDVVFLTDEERQKMQAAIDCLHLEYRVGLNRLMRAAGQAVDLRSVFEKRKQVKATIMDDIARVTGLSKSELMGVQKLDLIRRGELRTRLEAQDLIEPLRGYVASRQRTVQT